MKFVARKSRSGDTASSSARRPRASSAATRRAPWLLAGFGVLIAGGLGLWTLAKLATVLDRRLIGDAVGLRTGPLTAAAHGASLLGRSWLLIPLAAFIGLALARRLGIRAWAPLVAVAGADGLQNAVKALVNRPRPGVSHLEHVTGSSFPSGHATEFTAFQIAILALVWATGSRPVRRGAAVLAIVLVGAVGASRVYLGVHYPTDVAAGIILGGALGAGVIRWSS